MTPRDRGIVQLNRPAQTIETEWHIRSRPGSRLRFSGSQRSTQLGTSMGYKRWQKKRIELFTGPNLMEALVVGIVQQFRRARPKPIDITPGNDLAT